MQVKNISDSIRRSYKRGLFVSITMLLYYFIYSFRNIWFDLKYGTDTRQSIEINKLGIDIETQRRSVRYQVTDTLKLIKVLKKIRIPGSGVFVDLGCGKGKALLIASEVGFKKARGIEVSPGLSKIALKNCSTYKEKCRTNTEFEIFNLDALNYIPQDDEEVFYMFNPFNSNVLIKVLNSINESVIRKSRKITIIYNNPLHENVIATDRNFKKTGEYKMIEERFVIYENTIRT